MKKIVIAIIIIWFSATLTSYAGLYTSNKESTVQYGSIYGSGNSFNTSGEDSGFGALYRAPAIGPGERPGSGTGIGQEAPLGDGLILLIMCSVAQIVVKIFNDKRKKQS